MTFQTSGSNYHTGVELTAVVTTAAVGLFGASLLGDIDVPTPGSTFELGLFHFTTVFDIAYEFVSAFGSLFIIMFIY